jgi:hypothetical protein
MLDYVRTHQQPCEATGLQKRIAHNELYAAHARGRRELMSFAPPHEYMTWLLPVGAEEGPRADRGSVDHDAFSASR